MLWLFYLFFFEKKKSSQFDGSTHYFNLGTPQSWTMNPYHDPVTKEVMPDQGVVITISGGDECSNGVSRSTTMWFKCDPSVTSLPPASRPIAMSETDPSNGQITPCQYYFAPIPFAGFCPNQSGTDGSSMVLHTAILEFSQTLMSVQAITTSRETFVSNGFTCTPRASCSEKTYLCSSFSFMGSFSATIGYLSVSVGNVMWEYSASPFSINPKCNPASVDAYLRVQGSVQWEGHSNGTYTAVGISIDGDELNVLSITPKATICNNCTHRRE